MSARNAKDRRRPIRAPAAVGPYSHAVAASGLLFCSGQIPLDPSSGELVGESAAEQAAAASRTCGRVRRRGRALADAVR